MVIAISTAALPLSLKYRLFTGPGTISFFLLGQLFTRCNIYP